MPCGLYDEFTGTLQRVQHNNTGGVVRCFHGLISALNVSRQAGRMRLRVGQSGQLRDVAAPR